jgi:hypothetical protein
MFEDKLKQRERGEEDQFFRHWDEMLLKNLRQRAKLGEITTILAEKLQVDDPDLLKRIMDLGITKDTGPAFLLAPLVQVAWAEGKVTGREQETILNIAHERGIENGSPAHTLLLQWLRVRPADELFETAVTAIRVGISVLPDLERSERIKSMVAMCHRVAASSGGLARLLGITHGVSQEEEAILDAISAKLTAA